MRSFPIMSKLLESAAIWARVENSSWGIWPEVKLFKRAVVVVRRLERLEIVWVLAAMEAERAEWLWAREEAWSRARVVISERELAMILSEH